MKARLEKIWNDPKVRSPNGPTIWIDRRIEGVTKEAAGLFWLLGSKED